MFVLRITLFTLFLSFFVSSKAQNGTFLGLQVTPIGIGTLDIHLEERLSNTISLHLGTGFRTQRLDRRDPGVRILSDFSTLTNTGAYTSLGIRLFNPETGVDYPYVQFGMTAVWYRDQYLDNLGNPIVAKEITWGSSATIGYVINFNTRWQLDLGLQMGYSPPRRDLLAYYYPGLGYSTFGLGRYGVVGGHVQPVITLKYKIRLGKRERLREIE